MENVNDMVDAREELPYTVLVYAEDAVPAIDGVNTVNPSERASVVLPMVKLLPSELTM
jgi:hypothetical protein